VVQALEGTPSSHAEPIDERPEDSYPGYDRRWLVLAVTLVGFFSTGFLITIVSASLPRIGEDLGASDASTTWVLTGAMLTFGICTPLMGRVSDLAGYRRMYLWGLTASTVLAVAIALSWNIASLVAFRVAWAVAGAASGPASMAIIMRSFPPHERVRAMGWWSFVAAGAPVLGVVVGGPVVEAFSWRVVFAAQVPLSIVAIVLARIFLPSDGPRKQARLDLAGSALAGLTVGLLMFAVNRGAEWGWGNPVVVASLVATPLGAVLFVRVEKSASSPLVPVQFLKKRNFAAPILAHVMASFAYMGGFFITPFLLQRVFEFSVTKTGFFMLPRPVAFTLAAPLAGALAVRIGERRTILGAMVAMTASMGALSYGATQHSGMSIVAGLVLSGVALGSASPSLSSTVANSVPGDYLATAGAASNLASTVGAVVGMETLRSVAATVGGTGGAYGLAYAGAGVVALLAIAPALLIRSYERTARPVAASAAVEGSVGDYAVSGQRGTIKS
jgi:EmrB/QacA subfamily drug resistance transporter